MSRTEAITTIIVALIGAGVLNWARDAWRAHRAAKSLPRAGAAIAEVDASLVVVAKARDELEEDNRRLRLTLSEERQAHEKDRSRWDREKTQLRSEIDALETKLRGLLAEVEALRSRAQTT